jgi:hypothetical protein
MNKLFSLPEDQLRQLIKESVKDNISEGIGDRLFGGSGGRDAPRRTSRYGTRASGATTQAGIGGGRGRAQMAGRSIITTIEQTPMASQRSHMLKLMMSLVVWKAEIKEP